MNDEEKMDWEAKIIDTSEMKVNFGDGFKVATIRADLLLAADAYMKRLERVAGLLVEAQGGLDPDVNVSLIMDIEAALREVGK